MFQSLKSARMMCSTTGANGIVSWAGKSSAGSLTQRQIGTNFTAPRAWGQGKPPSRLRVSNSAYYLSIPPLTAEKTHHIFTSLASPCSILSGACQCAIKRRKHRLFGCRAVLNLGKTPPSSESSDADAARPPRGAHMPRPTAMNRAQSEAATPVERQQAEFQAELWTRFR